MDAAAFIVPLSFSRHRYLILTREDPKDENHEARVAKVQNCRDTVVNVELGRVVEGGIQEDVDGGPSRDDKGAPPPVVILARENG